MDVELGCVVWVGVIICCVFLFISELIFGLFFCVVLFFSPVCVSSIARRLPPPVFFGLCLDFPIASELFAVARPLCAVGAWYLFLGFSWDLWGVGFFGGFDSLSCVSYRVVVVIGCARLCGVVIIFGVHLELFCFVRTVGWAWRFCSLFGLVCGVRPACCGVCFCGLVVRVFWRTGFCVLRQPGV